MLTGHIEWQEGQMWYKIVEWSKKRQKWLSGSLKLKIRPHGRDNEWIGGEKNNQFCSFCRAKEYRSKNERKGEANKCGSNGTDRARWAREPERKGWKDGHWSKHFQGGRRTELNICNGTKRGMEERIHAKWLQSCPTLCDPVDLSSPGASVHGIL